MRSPPWILIVDDDPASVDIFQARLSAQGFQVSTAASGEEALRITGESPPDLILLDIVMPGLDGMEVCRRLKADARLPFIPVVMVTAKADPADIVAGLDAGGDEYLTKPVEASALVARVRSMLRIKSLHDTITDQARRLQAQGAELAELNESLTRRVDDQVAELERVSRLKRFLAPQVANLIVSSGDDSFLESHRREITVVSCDLRGYTSFSETGDPEEVMRIMRQFHATMGEIIFGFEGTVERSVGDAVMVMFNDPVPCPDAPARAVRMATTMRQRVAELSRAWRTMGYELGLGVGIAQGYATLGKLGFEGRFDYAAIGTVTNLAFRLCEEAGPGQIFISQRVHAAVRDLLDVEPVGERELKGFLRPVPAYNVLRVKGIDSTTSGRRPSPLSPREEEVAALVSQGLSNREIAERLVISDRTVESHVQSALNKLGFRTRAQIAGWAVGQGISSDRASDQKG